MRQRATRALLAVAVAACSAPPLPACAVDGCPNKNYACGPVQGRYRTFQPLCTTDGCTFIPVEGACPEDGICGNNESFPWQPNCIKGYCRLGGCTDRVMGCASDTVALHATGTCDTNNDTCSYSSAFAVDCTMVDYVDENHQTYCDGDNLITYSGEHYCGVTGCTARPVALDCAAMGMVCDVYRCHAP